MHQCCIGNEKVFSGERFGGYMVFVCLCFWEHLVFVTGGILDDQIPYNNDDVLVAIIIMAVHNNILCLSGLHIIL